MTLEINNPVDRWCWGLKKEAEITADVLRRVWNVSRECGKGAVVRGELWRAYCLETACLAWAAAEILAVCPGRLLGLEEEMVWIRALQRTWHFLFGVRLSSTLLWDLQPWDPHTTKRKIVWAHWFFPGLKKTWERSLSSQHGKCTTLAVQWKFPFPYEKP